MADRWAVASGNWSNTATWNGGTLPTASDDVFADGFTVTIDQNVAVLSIRTTQRTGGTAGGGFTLGIGFNVTANCIAGTTGCLTVNNASGTNTVTGSAITNGSPSFPNAAITKSGAGTLIVIGDMLGGANGNTAGLDMSGGAVTVTGNPTGGSSTSSGIRHRGGNLTVIGNLTGGTGSSANGLLYQPDSGSPSAVITGNVTSGTGYQASGIQTSGSFIGSITVNGNVSATTVSQDNPGIRLGSTGNALNTVTINGNVTANAFSGIVNSGPTTVIVNGIVTASAAAVGVSSSSTGFTILNGNCIGGSSGLPAVVSSRILIHPSATIQHAYRVNNGGVAGVERSLYTGGVNLNQPVISNVRSGTVYGASNEFTGILVIPSAQYVSAGVPVDSGVGTLQHLTLNDLQAALAPNAPVGVERSVDDTKAISFSWPVSGASISGQKSVDYGAYSAVSGAISFLRTEGSRHYYSLAYSQYDRVSQEATIRYKMMDGTYTKYFNLRLVPPGITAQQIETQLNDDFSGVLTGISGIQSRLPATLVNGRMNATIGEMQTNVVTDTAVSAAAVTKIQSGILTTSQFNVRSLPSGQYSLESTAQSLVTLVGDVPTVAEFEARTIPSGDYFLAGTSVDIASVSSGAVQDIFSTYPITEDYAASGMAGTPAQILYFMQQTFSQFAISGVTISVKKLDGTTNAATFIMDSEKNPKSRTRVS